MEQENIICHVDKTDMKILIFKGIFFARPPSEIIILWLNSNKKNFSIPLSCNEASWCMYNQQTCLVPLPFHTQGHVS